MSVDQTIRDQAQTGITANDKTKIIEQKVKLTQLKILFDHLPQGLAATALNASLLAYIVADVVPGLAVKCWLAAMLVVCVARMAAALAFRKACMRSPDYIHWRKIFAYGALGTGVLWGLSGVFLFPESSYQHQAFIGFVLAGMAAGASGSMAAHDKIFRIFLVLTVAPYMIRLAIDGTPINLAMSAMCAAFIAALGMSSKRNARATSSALQLKFENDELLLELKGSSDDLQAANAALHTENEQRRDTESLLRTAMQASEEATRAKSQFLANMSHEIRTPMNGVFGMTDLLLRTDLDTRQKKLVGTINESAKSLLTIINDILDLSRIEAGKFELDYHEFNLRDMVERSVDLFAAQAHKKGLEVSLFVDKAVPFHVKGDSGRTKQIVLNLIGNALKFTKYGEINIRVTCLEAAAGRAKVLIEISDTGIGIDSAVLETLFNPFSQAETSISRRFGGTGLGLAISRHLADLMGGTIRLESTLGKGTRALVELPFETTETAAILVSDQAVLDDARILVIDDRETNRDIILNYLEGCSARVSLAHNTATAWPMLIAALEIKKPFHAAVVDMIMPDENGLEFARRIKAHPQLSGLKIIIATSLNWQGDLTAIRDAGIEAVLTKPIRRDDLVDAAARAITGTRHPGWRSELEERETQAVVAREPDACANFDAFILVAEDNPVNVEVAREYLSGLGCRVAIASNGLEAVAAIASTPFDAVFMDCQMPIMDGLSATRRIRAMEADRADKRIPIIAVTANAFAEDRIKCLDSGMDDYLSKPYSEHQIRDMLAKWLPKKIPQSVVHESDAASEGDEPPVAALTPDDDAAMLDQSVIAPLRKARPDLLHRLVKTYLAYAPTALNDLNKASRDGDFEQLGRLAHSLKSSSANLGAKELSSYCRQLEQSAGDKNSAATVNLVTAINTCFEKVHRALDRELTIPDVKPDPQRALG